MTDSMWRRCRRDHRDFINRLLTTVNMMSAAILKELTWTALTHEPGMVRQAFVDLLVEAASGVCASEEFETAELFFGWLIKCASLTGPGQPPRGDAKRLMMQWVCVTDPLQIGQDPECGYGLPSGFVN
jgi:hypothetical protein